MELDFRRFDEPDEVRTFEKGTFQLVRIGGMTIGRASYEPGWKWSEHVGPTVGATSCQIEHLGLVISGRAMAAMDDGREFEMEPGHLFSIPPGHDSWTATIRYATAADIGELARLRWQLYTEQEPYGEPFEAYVERFTAFAREALERDEWRAWCAEDQGRLIAAMWLQTVPRIPAPGHGEPRPIGYLTNMYVQPEHRSRGLGSRMVRELLAYCEASGVDLVLAFPAADAYDFYERNGFGRPPAPVVHDLGR